MTQAAGAHGHTSHPWGRWALVMVGPILAVVGIGWLAGWRSQVLTTPSMGRTAPVGTLVITRPTAPRAVRIGDVIVFHPPGGPPRSFVHRVTAITHYPGGPMFSTKGDINGSPDPWALRGVDLVGRPVLRVPDAGFALMMLPAALLGVVVIGLLTVGTSREVYVPARIIAGSLLASALLAFYKPLARVSLVGQVITGHDGDATVVPTGVLPLRVQAVGGTHTDLGPGQAGSVHLRNISYHGAFRVTAAAHLTGWWWLLLLSWAIPVLVAARCARRGATRRPGGHWSTTVTRPTRLRLFLMRCVSHLPGPPARTTLSTGGRRGRGCATPRL